MVFGIFNICFFLQNMMLLKQRDNGNPQGESSQVGEGTPGAPGRAGTRAPLRAATVVLVDPKMQNGSPQSAHWKRSRSEVMTHFLTMVPSLRVL